MQTDDYNQKVLKHLLKDGKEISRERMIQAKEQADEILKEIDNRFCSKGERDFVQESLKSKAIPSPKLLVKDHKKKDKWGQYPTRLVIPATNFTSSFPKLGCLGIKKILDDDETIDYVKKMIVQASQAKNRLEKLHINKSRNTIFSLYIESFYASITYSLVETTINYFATDLSMKNKLMIRECRKLIHFGMGNTLITFEDK
jgi:hypothetical protein